MELAADREKNRKERLTFIRLYAAWVKRVSNREWSRQRQNLSMHSWKTPGTMRSPANSTCVSRTGKKSVRSRKGQNLRLKENQVVYP